MNKQQDDLIEQTRALAKDLIGRISNRTIENDIQWACEMIFAQIYETLCAYIQLGPSFPVFQALVIRSMIEAEADFHWIILDKTKREGRANKYVDSYHKLRDEFFSQIKSEPTEIGKLAHWTSSSIEDRISAMGTPSKIFYDYFSYMAHVHPARRDLIWRRSGNRLFSQVYMDGLAIKPVLNMIEYLYRFGCISKADHNRIDKIYRKGSRLHKTERATWRIGRLIEKNLVQITRLD